MTLKMPATTTHLQKDTSVDGRGIDASLLSRLAHETMAKSGLDGATQT